MSHQLKQRLQKIEAAVGRMCCVDVQIKSQDDKQILKEIKGTGKRASVFRVIVEL